MSSRTILYVIGSLDLGGTERHLAIISPRLKRLGWDPVIYCIAWRGVQSAEVERNGVRVIGPPFEIRPEQTSIAKLFCLLAATFKLFGILLFTRPMIAHFFLPLAYLIGAPLALMSRVPVLMMSRRSLNRYQQRHPTLTRLELWLHRRMDAILGNSRAVVDELVNLEGCKPSKVHLIYNGIDVERIDQAATGVEDEPHVLSLIIVANLIPYKGHAELIDALALVRPQLPAKWRLLCVGRDDGIRAKLEGQVRKLGLSEHVRFLGERSDVASLLKQADIGLLCSHEEGFSNAILEFMAAGLPVIATDVGGNSESIVQKRTGLIVPPHNPPALGNAIVELTTNQAMRKQMGSAARRRIDELFTIDECVRRYDKLYNACLTANGDAQAENNQAS